MVDALASGASVRMDVEVRVLFWAGDSYREAMQALPLVHARIEALLNDEANKVSQRTQLGDNPRSTGR